MRATSARMVIRTGARVMALTDTLQISADYPDFPRACGAVEVQTLT